MIKVLLADDNEDFLELVQATIKSIDSDIQIEVVNNGYLALKEIRENYYDLLVTDFDMPVMSGVDLVRSLKKVRLTHVPKDVLMLSAFLEEGESDDSDLKNITYMQKEDFINEFRQYLIEELKDLKEQLLVDNKSLEEKGEIDVRHISDFRMDIVSEQLATMGYPVSISIKGVQIEGQNALERISRDQVFDCIFSLPNKESVKVKSRISDDLNLKPGQSKIEFVSLSLNDREVLKSYLNDLAA